MLRVAYREKSQSILRIAGKRAWLAAAGDGWQPGWRVAARTAGTRHSGVCVTLGKQQHAFWLTAAQHCVFVNRDSWNWPLCPFVSQSFLRLIRRGCNVGGGGGCVFLAACGPGGLAPDLFRGAGLPRDEWRFNVLSRCLVTNAYRSAAGGPGGREQGGEGRWGGVTEGPHSCQGRDGPLLLAQINETARRCEGLTVK